MSRQILFRGKRTDNGEWVAGYPASDAEKAYIICTVETDCIDGENTDLRATEWYEVLSETVGQFTGQGDKYGWNICEEDFVRIDNEWIGRVIWSQTEAAFIVFPNDDIEHEKYCLGYYVYEHDVEVIGNIFDNPKLLEGGEGN